MTMWCTPELSKDLEKFKNRQERYFWFLRKPEHDIVREKRELLRRNLKFCDVIVGNTVKTAFIDNKTNIIYKIGDNYEKTYEVQKGAKFIKYLTMMEI